MSNVRCLSQHTGVLVRKYLIIDLNCLNMRNLTNRQQLLSGERCPTELARAFDRLQVTYHVN